MKVLEGNIDCLDAEGVVDAADDPNTPPPNTEVAAPKAFGVDTKALNADLTGKFLGGIVNGETVVDGVEVGAAACAAGAKIDGKV